MESRSIFLLQQALEEIILRAKERGELQSRRDTGSIVSALVGVYFQVMMFGMMEVGNESHSIRLKEQLAIVWDGIVDRERMV
ncbi:hypothetical protein D3C84_1225670 [compost metagenome]